MAFHNAILIQELPNIIDKINTLVNPLFEFQLGDNDEVSEEHFKLRGSFSIVILVHFDYLRSC